MKKKLAIFLIILLSFKLFSYDISGVWIVNRFQIHDLDKSKIKVSWGEDFVIRNSNCLVIDSFNESSKISISGQGEYNIVSQNKLQDNVFQVKFDFTRGKFEIEFTIHFLSDITFWIEQMDSNSLFPTGKENVYYRISAPTGSIILKTPVEAVLNDSRVRIRSSPDLQSDILGYTEKGEVVFLKSVTSRKEVIGDMDFPWYFIETEEGVLGWLYGGYIEYEIEEIVK